jgi:hypothetical protein
MNHKLLDENKDSNAKIQAIVPPTIPYIKQAAHTIFSYLGSLSNPKVLIKNPIGNINVISVPVNEP